MLKIPIAKPATVMMVLMVRAFSEMLVRVFFFSSCHEAGEFFFSAAVMTSSFLS
jgi:hypothetical protein